MTSTTDKGNSITDLVFVDTLTGQVSITPFQGAGETAVLLAVSSRLGINSNKWKPKRPVLYKHENGDKVWIMPIIDKITKLTQSYAVVDSDNINNISIEKELTSALRAYSRVSGAKQNNKDDSELVTLSGVIDVYNIINRNGVISAYILLKDSKEIIECQVDLNDECLVMKTGQELTAITYELNNGQMFIKDVIKGGNK